MILTFQKRTLVPQHFKIFPRKMIQNNSIQINLQKNLYFDDLFYLSHVINEMKQIFTTLFRLLVNFPGFFSFFNKQKMQNTSRKSEWTHFEWAKCLSEKKNWGFFCVNIVFVNWFLKEREFSFDWCLLKWMDWLLGILINSILSRKMRFLDRIEWCDIDFEGMDDWFKARQDFEVC